MKHMQTYLILLVGHCSGGPVLLAGSAVVKCRTPNGEVLGSNPNMRHRVVSLSKKLIP